MKRLFKKRTQIFNQRLYRFLVMLHREYLFFEQQVPPIRKIWCGYHKKKIKCSQEIQIRHRYYFDFVSILYYYV